MGVSASRPQRVYALDALRGFTIISMVAFHACYDLAYIYGVELPWFTFQPLQSLWRISISWVFLALAGWMTAYSKSNAKRAARYAAAACLVWLVTSVASIDTPVSFGILFCMATSTLIWAAIKTSCASRLDRVSRFAPIVLVALFLLLYRIPQQRYPLEGLAWLGFPSPAFTSGDYYPVIPFSLLYLSFAFASHRFRASGRTFPLWAYRDTVPPLSAIGRHSLLIYLIHQPLLIALFNVIPTQ